MTRRLSVCRWCGVEPPPSTDPAGRGRPPAFCCREHRRRHVAAFRTAEYRGAVQLVEDCGAACALHGDVVSLPGPVRGPGAWADAVEQVAVLLHGHPVTVRVEPVEFASDATAWSASIPRTPAARGHLVVVDGGAP